LSDTGARREGAEGVMLDRLLAAASPAPALPPLLCGKLSLPLLYRRGMWLRMHVGDAQGPPHLASAVRGVHGAVKKARRALGQA